MNAVVFLTREDEAVLAGRLGIDATASDAFVASHMPLVAKMARRFMRHGAEREDLLQAGAAALVIAAKRFNPAVGVRFATYATWWIRAEMQNCMIGAPTVTRGRSNRRCREISTSGPAIMMSLDAPVSSDGEASTFADLLEDPSASPEQMAEQSIDSDRLSKALHDAIDSLSPRHRDVIKRRYLTEEPEGLEQIGRSLGISKERVRQIQNEALAVLKRKMRVH